MEVEVQIHLVVDSDHLLEYEVFLYGNRAGGSLGHFTSQDAVLSFCVQNDCDIKEWS